MRLITYLHFNGQCEEALNFYKKSFKGKVLQFSRMGDSSMPVPETHKNCVMHARLQFDDNLLYMSDTLPGNATTVGNNIRLSIEFRDTKKMNDLFEKLSEGGKIIMPLQNTFWNARFGQLVDKFGIGWMMNCELKR
ncbi:MAG TPA: VOC family protein [Puia sp.]|nr:VOC family protein [Puia sp.]